uniref:WD repeat domain, phosphoinositide interacting 1 n=1 Tax=Astyanax mexicanus TaxID=7994 RepID=A0A8B9HAN0_ASTMX
MEGEDGAGGACRPGLGCASFNQDSTSLAVGTKTGYRLFSVTAVDRLECIHESAESPDVYIVERLFSSSLVVVVSQAMPRRMNVYHFKKGTEICNYSYSNTILAVRLNRQRLVVCLEESIYIHNIKDMKLLKTLLNTPPNPSGLCALSINHSNSYLAYPGSATIGEIIVYDANNLNTVTMIPAHDSPLAAITFNASGTKLASASERGTVIRVFSIPEGLRLFEFRRGMKRYVNISSLSFSPDAQFLCASSNTETVHIFKLEQHGPSGEEETPTWSAYVGKMFTAASSYLPSQVSGMMSQDRAFATVRLHTAGQKNVCTLATIQKLPRLLVASSDEQLFIYNIDPQDGGECTLHRGLLGLEREEAAVSEGPGAPQSYAATAAIPTSAPVSATLTGYSEDGGVSRGEVIPEHEFAAGPVCLDDETEFPPRHRTHRLQRPVSGGSSRCAIAPADHHTHTQTNTHTYLSTLLCLDHLKLNLLSHPTLI